MQNLAPAAFTCPQEQVHSAAGSGFLVPHSMQNLPVFSAPQLGHFHVAGAAGLGVPHSMQNLPVFSAPQLGHFHAPAGGAAWGWGACCGID